MNTPTSDQNKVLLDNLVQQVGEAKQAASEAKVAAAEATKVSNETHDLVKEIHKGFFQKGLGYDESLIEWLSSVRINMQGGNWSGKLIMGLLGFIIASGGAWATIWAMTHFGDSGK